MEEEITNADDYVDWIKWVYNAEKGKQAIFESTNCVKVPILLQVHQTDSGDAHNNCKEQLVLLDNHEMSTRWEDICQKIQVDHNLNEEKKATALEGLRAFTKMCLLGTKGNQAIVPLENISQTHKGFCLARCFLVNYHTRKKQR